MKTLVVTDQMIESVLIELANECGGRRSWTISDLYEHWINCEEQAILHSYLLKCGHCGVLLNKNGGVVARMLCHLHFLDEKRVRAIGIECYKPRMSTTESNYLMRDIGFSRDDLVLSCGCESESPAVLTYSHNDQQVRILCEMCGIESNSLSMKQPSWVERIFYPTNQWVTRVDVHHAYYLCRMFSHISKRKVEIPHLRGVI